MSISRHNGERISERDHIRQSLEDILTTPVGSRVLARDYGSELPALVDAPINDETRLKAIRNTAEAIERSEPRITLTRVVVDRAETGRMDISVFGTDAQGGPVAEEGILV